MAWDRRETPELKNHPARRAPSSSGKLDVTVTFLEMEARPALPPVPRPSGQSLALLRAQKPPIDFYRFIHRSVGAPWLWYERLIMPETELAAILEDDAVEIHVLYANGVPAGFAELDLRLAETADLAYFGLMPWAIGRGLGRYLLSWAIERAWTTEPERLRVNTCTLDHPKALPLYQKCGFKPYRQETIVIDDPRVTGILPFKV